MKKKKIITHIASLLIPAVFLSGCSQLWDNMNDRAGNSLEDGRDIFVLYTGGTTEEIADQILEEILYNIASGELDAVRNMYCHYRIRSFMRSELQSMIDAFTGEVLSYERLRLEHNYETPEDGSEDRYAYSIYALYRIVTTDDTYQCYYQAYRMNSYETNVQGLYSLGILRESEVPSDGTFPYVPSADGPKVFLGTDRHLHIDDRDDSMAHVGHPADFQADDYSPELFLNREKRDYVGSPVHEPQEAYRLTGYLMQAINEKDTGKIMALFSPAAIENAALTQADIDALTNYFGTVETFVGGQMYAQNFIHYSNDHGFTGDNFMITARYLCKTDGGYILMNIRFFDRYDDDEAGYLGLWSIEAERREDSHYRKFKSQLADRKAGISLRE